VSDQPRTPKEISTAGFGSSAAFQYVSRPTAARGRLAWSVSLLKRRCGGFRSRIRLRSHHESGNWLDAGLRARPMRLFYWEKRIKIDYSNDSVFIETLPLSAY
jgi:hypothetical protein